MTATSIAAPKIALTSATVSERLPEGAVINRTGATFRKLPEEQKQGLTESRAIALMLAQPGMIKRPVLDIDGTLIVGFKPDIYAKAFA